MENRVASERLRALQSVTDTALSYLPLDELLDELLRRVVEIMDVDTAAILLLEADGRSLVPHAARGLDGELDLGVRIPVGAGFAGRVAAGHRPVVVTDVQGAGILNPVLRGRGLKSLLGLPLLVEGRVMGVVHVGSLQNRVFDDADVGVLQMVGDRAAIAVRDRMIDRERGFAEAMQQILMPALPEFPWITLSGRYMPAAEARLGGDWYDAFALPGGRLGLAIGDVAGRGFHAAAIMGQLRSGLRACAMDGSPPDDVITRLSHLLRQLDRGSSATLLYLVIDPLRDTLAAAAAGHPPLLLSDGEGAFDYLDLPPSVPLGTVRAPRYGRTEVPFDAGAVIVLYTDGLVERIGEALELGFERLRAAVSAAPRDPKDLCDSLLAGVLPEGPTRDDAALLVARTLPITGKFAARLPAEVDSIPLLRRLLGRWLQDAGASEVELEEIALSTSEACANVIEHAYAPGEAAMEVEASLSADGDAVVSVRDHGHWREPRGRHRGRGFVLMRGLMDSVDTIRDDEGTTVRLSRRLEAPSR
ncbi:MAG TPA: SpoIIE family protein phosphatase [Thermoleophilaceae bacterium]